MAKNFDEARKQRAIATIEERTFILGGQTFRARDSVRPEALMAYEALTEDTPVDETMRIVDEALIAMIEDDPGAEEGSLGGHDRYRLIRADESDPIGVQDLIELVQWLIEVMTGRPSERPGDSVPGPQTTGTKSTDDSSLPEIPAEPQPST